MFLDSPMGQLERGERVKPIRLRDGDLLDELRDAFNRYLESLEQGSVAVRGDASADDSDTDSSGDNLLGELQSLTAVVKDAGPPTPGQTDAASQPAGSLTEQ